MLTSQVIFLYISSPEQWRTVRTRGFVWKTKIVTERKTRQIATIMWILDFHLWFDEKIVWANLFPTWLSCLAWKVSNLPVKNRQLNYWKDVIIWIIRKIRGKNVDSNEKIICAEAVVINWANFSYVLKKFDDIVLEHRNLTRFRKRVKIDSTVEVVQRFDFVHNFV